MTRVDAAQPAGPRNVLDFLLEFFHCADELDLPGALSGADPEKLTELLDADFLKAGWKFVPPLPEGHVRPFLETSGVFQEATWLRGGLPFNVHDLQDEDSAFKFVDSIKHRLLYCHSLAVDDTLREMASQAAAQKRLTRNGVPQGETGAVALANYAVVLLHMKELIREGVLHLVVRPSLIPTKAVTAEVDLHLKGAESEARLDFAELLKAAPPEIASKLLNDLREGGVGEELLRGVCADAAFGRLASAIGAAAGAGGRANLYLPFLYDVESFEICLRKSAALAVATQPLVTAPTYDLAPLLDLSLPGLAELDPAELVAIRKGDEFERFREQLRDAIAMADRVRLQDRNRPLEMKRIVDARMKEAQARLKESLPKSPIKPAARAGIATLVGGAITTTAAVYGDPNMTQAVLSSTIGGAIGAAVYAFLARAAEPPEAALVPGRAVAARNAHYVAVLK